MKYNHYHMVLVLLHNGSVNLVPFKELFGILPSALFFAMEKKLNNNIVILIELNIYINTK